MIYFLINRLYNGLFSLLYKSAKQVGTASLAALLMLNMSCSKSGMVAVNPDGEFFRATIDGQVIDFDNEIKAQINYKEVGTANNPNVFLIEATKVSGSRLDGFYLMIESIPKITTASYQSNSSNPIEVTFLAVGYGGSPDDPNIVTNSKATITALSDEYAEGTFSGEVFADYDTNGKKTLIENGTFRVKYVINK
ncbi:hypothetical protein LZD49_31180 [Dyadobacter sp. CY261]|uniref:hypothetical protein n=1 Tax=Dyadobacter sp. CY261 TaxID=2907203 RepID=UPI001F16C9DB|nr:hypothetical protein [Dyadobacter sp. CY261]MCF0074989.1 hypothetical protein [Dyadobacter sp. CY261]